MFNVDSILSGPFWTEKVRVIASRTIEEDMIKLDAVGVDSNTFYPRVINYTDLDKIVIEEERTVPFSADGEGFFLFVEAHRIRNAFQFDPLYAVNISQVDPLPHQIDAVYYHVLQNPRIRFLLADDPGAGKTIMAGLIIKELKYRGIVKRILIVAPGHLKYQWLREMKDKFHEKFKLIARGSMDAAWGQNLFEEEDQLITSIDFIKQDDVLNSLEDTNWDLIIVDEAHKMAAYKFGQKISRTARYRFGEVASKICNHLLFLTATPHRGDQDNFRLFLDLLEPNMFVDNTMLNQSIRDRDNPLFLRRLKEDMKNFDGSKIFPPRYVHTIKFKLSEDEKELYNSVTEYVEKHFNRAIQKDKRNVAFAMLILQRRLASSVRAVRMSLDRRRKRLQDLLERADQYEMGTLFDEDYLEDLSEEDRWKKEEELLERLTSANNKEELKAEIDALDTLCRLARDVEKKEVECKLLELKSLIDTKLLNDSDQKLLIFTESRDTLEYLVEKLKTWGFKTTQIHGLMKMDDRITAEKEFLNEAQICVATEAAGEGINLQFCSFMVNYDIPWNPNRLEQRMGRIHRYGQQKEVYIYNLVANDTREGKILVRLFDKINTMSQQMGSDRVFDVIGDVWGSTKSLKDLIVDAISNQRTMNEILADFDKVPDEEAINKVREVTMESLSTKHIDLYRILGEQRKAKENRLVPEYIEAYFLRSGEVWDIPIEKRTDGFYRVPTIPFEIRYRRPSFTNQYGLVLQNYNKISFIKEKAFKEQGEFVAMGHPLLEATIEHNLVKFRTHGINGAVFIDPDGEKDGLIWVVEGEVRDGNNVTAGKRLFCVFQNNEGVFSLVNSSIFWDLKPMPAGTKTASNFTYNQDSVISFVSKQCLVNYRIELTAQRIKDAKIKEKYGIRSLDTLIAKSEERLADYATKKMLGEKVVASTEQRELKNRETLERKRENLVKQITAETNLSMGVPKILGVSRVIPSDSILPEMHSSKEIEIIGMNIAIDYEKHNNRKPEDVSTQNLGYDIHSSNENEHRYIEVKARSNEGEIILTPNEWLMAHRLQDEYWLYIISNAKTKPELFIIQNPAVKLQPTKVIDTVRYVVNDWQNEAKAAE